MKQIVLKQVLEQTGCRLAPLRRGGGSCRSLFQKRPFLKRSVEALKPIFAFFLVYREDPYWHIVCFKLR